MIQDSPVKFFIDYDKKITNYGNYHNDLIDSYEQIKIIVQKISEYVWQHVCDGIFDTE